MVITVENTGDLSEVSGLLANGRSRDGLALVDILVAAAPDGAPRADALGLRLAALLNLRRTADYPAAVKAAFSAARMHPTPARFGQLYALAAVVAYQDGSLESCASLLVRSARALNAVDVADPQTARAWHNLALAYSFTGFHGHALGTIEHARRVATSIGMSTSRLSAPSIRLRLAVSHDQLGDTDACVRILSDLTQELAARRREGVLATLRPIGQRAYGYALARLGALGHGGLIDEQDPRPLLSVPDDSTTAGDLAALGAVCLAIAGRRPTEAIGRLESMRFSAETLGPAEGHRLRALAHLAAGNHALAYDADRQAFRIATMHWERLRDLFIDGVAARLDHEDLRRDVARYSGEANTDPLTGLPNRRFLEHHVAELVARGESAVLGVCDLDGFKAVNTAHGHICGDLVLQRVGRVLNRVMRKGDFVARYGGDEFVVVLPTTSRVEAQEIAHRIVNAVGGENWGELVPGTPVGVTIGWANVSSDGPFTSVADAFAAADHAMLRAKNRPKAS